MSSRVDGDVHAWIGPKRTRAPCPPAQPMPAYELRPDDRRDVFGNLLSLNEHRLFVHIGAQNLTALIDAMTVFGCKLVVGIDKLNRFRSVFTQFDGEENWRYNQCPDTYALEVPTYSTDSIQCYRVWNIETMAESALLCLVQMDFRRLRRDATNGWQVLRTQLSNLIKGCRERALLQSPPRVYWYGPEECHEEVIQNVLLAAMPNKSRVAHVIHGGYGVWPQLPCWRMCEGNGVDRGFLTDTEWVQVVLYVKGVDACRTCGLLEHKGRCSHYPPKRQQDLAVKRSSHYRRQNQCARNEMDHQLKHNAMLRSQLKALGFSSGSESGVAATDEHNCFSGESLDEADEDSDQYSEDQDSEDEEKSSIKRTGCRNKWVKLREAAKRAHKIVEESQ